MSRSGENVRSVFILLFLNVAFFLFEHQDPEKYAALFGFDWTAVKSGEVWRIFTWQFAQPGEQWLETVALFVTLLLLYMAGAAIEEEWGTRRFLTLFAVSTLASAGVAAWLDVPLHGTYFVYYTLLFVYATAFPQQVVTIFGVIPMRSRLLALVSFGALVFAILAGSAAHVAALAGAAVGFFYSVLLRVRIVIVTAQDGPSPVAAPRIDTTALHNAARVAAMKQALSSASTAEAERLIAQCVRDVVPNVNICPPPDFKPEAPDGYCIRCEGFAECSARHLRARLAATATGLAATATGSAAPSSSPAPPEPAPLA